MSNITDVIILTKNTLTVHQFDELSRNVQMNEGVISRSRNIKTPQCLMLVYNSARTHAKGILDIVNDTGVKASLVGI
jgi:hypothetical protein